MITDRLTRVPSGPGKPKALRDVVKKEIDAAFGNSRWDIEMLTMAKYAFAVNPNPDLEAVAQRGVGLLSTSPGGGEIIRMLRSEGRPGTRRLQPHLQFHVCTPRDCSITSRIRATPAKFRTLTRRRRLRTPRAGMCFV